MTRAWVSGKLGLAMAMVVGLLSGCDSYGGLTQETMAACINEAAIKGPYSASSTLRDDRMTFIVRPGPNVSEAQAKIANACISRTIDGGRSKASATAPAVAATPASSRPASVEGPSCEAGGGVFQGGAGYCAR
ncbi:hypothetical protein [Tabrizicola sp.]|uniref:hypothetical protein n=1 Tax=Tabrizicola sp. TaxID=2005166 RepID=UPI002FDEA210